MGKYNRYYEDYYKKKDEQNNDVKLEANNDLENQSQSRYVIRGSNNGYNKGQNNKNQDVVSEIITIVTATTLIPTIFFAGVFMCKNTEGTPKALYEHVKSAVTTNGFYKDKIELALKNSGISIVNPNESLSDSDKQSTIGKESELDKLADEPLDESLSTSGNVSIDEVEVDKEKQEDTIKHTKGEEDEKKAKTNVEIKLDEKYKGFVETLNGATVKAKSENGVVLSCQYKILASPVSGVVEEIGENAEGDFAVITHADGLKTLYYNLPKINLEKGQAIKKGEKIVDIKEEKEIVFKIKENDDFISPKAYAEFIK